MEFTKIDIQKVRNFQKVKYNLRQQKVDLLYQKAIQDFNIIVEIIIEKYKPKKIYQWGSLLNKKHFSEMSDIDIALEGIDNAETFFCLIAEVENLTEFPLDIIEMEKIHILHKNMILNKGKLIYERN